MKKIFILLLGLYLSAAHGYYTLNTNIGANFAADLVHVNVANLSCDNIGRTPTELLHLIQQAVDKFWNDVPTSRLVLTAGELKDVSSAFKTEKMCSSTTASGGCTVNSNLIVDREILISCNNETTANFPSGSILGLTVPNNIQDRHIVGALFLLNDAAGTGLASKTDDEMITILAHELGHAIGLGHASGAESLMYYHFSTTQKKLSEDDINGLTYLYGINQPDILSCNSIRTTTHWPSVILFALAFLIGILTTRFHRRS